MLHGASFTAESDGRLDIDSTGTITLNASSVAAVGSFAAPNATIGSGGMPEKELHVVGDGSMADADEQLRVVDKTSGMVLALGADPTAAFVQATRPAALPWSAWIGPCASTTPWPTRVRWPLNCRLTLSSSSSTSGRPRFATSLGLTPMPNLRGTT